MVILYCKAINTIEGNKAGRDNILQKGVVTLNKVYIRCWGRDVTENVTLEQGFEEDEGGSQVDIENIRRKAVSSSGDGMCKGPEVGL